MADNETVDNGSNPDYRVATDKVTYEGDADANIQLVKLVTVSGSEGSKTATAVTTGAQYVEDSPITADAGQGTLVVARRDDALSTLTPAENDAVGLRVNGSGALWTADAGAPTQLAWGNADGVTVANVTADTTDALLWVYNGSTADRARGDTTNGLDVDVTRVGGTVTTGGDVVHDSPDAGNPIKIGGKGRSSQGATTVANNDRVDAGFNLEGGQYVIPGNLTTPADGEPNQGYGLVSWSGSNYPLEVFQSGYNGSTWDRTRTVESVSAAPNVDTGIQAVGIGPGYDRKTNPTGVAATSTSNAVEVIVNGADMVSFHVTTIGTTPGSMIFQTSGDDAAWATAGMVIKQSTGPDTRVEGSFVPAVDDVYLVRTTGVRRVRYKVNAVYASGTATVKVTASAGAAMVKAQDMVGAPHNIGYAPTSAGAQYSSAQTSATIGPTVSSTQRMCVTSLQIQCGGTVAATQVSIYFGTSTFTRGTSRTIFDGEFAPSATSKPGFAIAPVVPFMGAADEELKITSVGAANPLTVTYWYYLIAA